MSVDRQSSPGTATVRAAAVLAIVALLVLLASGCRVVAEPAPDPVQPPMAAVPPDDDALAASIARSGPHLRITAPSRARGRGVGDGVRLDAGNVIPSHSPTAADALDAPSDGSTDAADRAAAEGPDGDDAARSQADDAADERETLVAAVDGRIVRINAGGPAVTAGGVTWLEDQYLVAAGAAFSNPVLQEIAGTDADAVYVSERNTGGDGPDAVLQYAIPVPDGNYQVLLHFAEIYFGTPGNPEAEAGQRVFDVLLEGQPVLVDFDVFAAAGASATAVVESFTVSVTDGVIDLVVRNGAANRGKLSALEILPLDGGG